MTQKEYILDHIPLDELLAGLAEEASELAQAALKYRRALTGTNPTPVTEVEAVLDLEEEVSDVLLYMGILNLIKTVESSAEVEQVINEKAERWVERLREKETPLNMEEIDELISEISAE